jgi:hypothetical protein
MVVEKDAWERGECRMNVTESDDADGGGGDESSSDYSWGRVHHGRCHGTHLGQRHEATGERVNGRSWVAGGIGMGRVERLCSRSACVVGAGDRIEDPEVGKAIVGQAAYSLTTVSSIQSQ